MGRGKTRKIKLIEVIECPEWQDREKLTDGEVKKYIENILEIESFSDLKKLEIMQRNNKLKELKKIKGASIIQIARIIGMSAKMVERAIK